MNIRAFNKLDSIHDKMEYVWEYGVKLASKLNKNKVGYDMLYTLNNYYVEEINEGIDFNEIDKNICTGIKEVNAFKVDDKKIDEWLCEIEILTI